MSKIAKHTAEQIARMALADTLDPRTEANDARWVALSEKAWLAMAPKATQEWVAKAPDGWLQTTTDIRVRGSNGYMLGLKWKERKPVAREWVYGREPLVKDGDLTEALMECMQEAERIREDWGKLRPALVQTILAAGTFKKLELAWPEGRSYYASYLNAENTGTALTVDFKEVNKSLGLPKDEAAKKPPTLQRRKATRSQRQPVSA
jgi:hypothetical protein